MFPEDSNSNPLFDKMEDAFLRILGLKPVDDIAFGSDAYGVTRLLSCPSFEPIEAVTLVFANDSITAHLAVSSDDAWELVACDENVEKSLSVEKRLVLSPMVEVSDLATWTKVVAALRDAGDCMSDNEEFGSHFHFAFGEGAESRFAWFNPQPDVDTAQCRLITAYRAIRDHLLHHIE